MPLPRSASARPRDGRGMLVGKMRWDGEELDVVSVERKAEISPVSRE